MGLVESCASNGYITIAGYRIATDETELRLQGRGLTNDDIKKLERMSNLKKLYLTENCISDISPLRSLTNLTELYLGKNMISDEQLMFLLPLINLETLSLHGNGITDIKPLRVLTSLTYLDLSDNDISDLTPLQKLSDLKKEQKKPALETLKLKGNSRLSAEQIQDLQAALPTCNISDR